MLAAIVALAFGVGIVVPAGAQGSVAARSSVGGARAHVSDYVSTLVGTESKRELSTGNTYPAVARPWGMNFWSPQTGKMGDGWMYTYTADKIVGFKQTHQPSPWINDYGQFCIMPVTVSRSTVSDPAASGAEPGAAGMRADESGAAVWRGAGPAFKERDRASWFSHKSETAKPYLYSVYLADYNVFAEVSAAQRGAMLRFAFPEEKLSYIVVDALDEGSAVSIDREHNRITGYSTKNDGSVPENFKDWFVIESDTPFEYVATVTDSTLAEGSLTAAGEHTYALVGFKTVKGQKVTLRVASSFISVEQAMLNLREVQGKSFEALVAEGRQVWDDVLGRIQVEDLELTGKGAAGGSNGASGLARSGGKKAEAMTGAAGAGAGGSKGSVAGAAGDDLTAAEEAATVDNLRTFYSCLYRATLFPRDLSEINEKGERVHYSPYNGTICSGYLFTDTGFWDTFRSLFPLLNLVYPEMSEKMQEGLVNTYIESGFLPEWASPGHRGCMVGNNSCSVVADAYLTGRRGYDIEKLWEAVVHGTSAVNLTVSSCGRLGWEQYNKLGYIPYNVGINESAARTLEYAYDDWCIYQLGKALGKPSSEIEVYAKRALNYRNLFDSSTGLMRGRNADGTFQSPFNPLKWGDAFTEGNSLQYTWSVFHDPAGLMKLMGGRERFVEKLDSMFTIAPDYDASYYGGIIHEIREMQVMNMGNYAHGNQPVQHMIYLYDWAGEPWKAQFRVRDVMRKLYSAAPDGYCGDEDNGQTSAWYVFSALGFYPVCPGSGQYAIGSPLFRKVSVALPGGKRLEIRAEGNSPAALYIESLKVNAKPWSHNFLNYSDLAAGARIEFRMSTEPNLQRGTAAGDRPYSFSD